MRAIVRCNQIIQFIRERRERHNIPDMESRLAQSFILACSLCGLFGMVVKPHKLTGCQEFTHGLVFNDSEAYGTWHLLHYRTEKTTGSGDPHCVEFTPVDDAERQAISEQIGEFVENLKWENLTLKMQVPCSSMESNRSRDYYLERLEGDGSYRTLQIPSSTQKLDLKEFHRYPMRLKIVEGQFLGMMDCHEKFLFLLGKQTADALAIDRLKEMMNIYWPEVE